jgi:hypothetical protein
VPHISKQNETLPVALLFASLDVPFTPATQASQHSTARILDEVLAVALET